FALTFGANGRVWAAGAMGLALFQDGRWRRFTTKDGLREDQLAFLEEDGDGVLWAGYWEPMGGARIERRGDTIAVENFDHARGLASDSVQTLSVDPHG